jgi:hypothetical protein
MSNIDLPPEDWPADARVQYIENNNTGAELVNFIADQLSIDDIDTQVRTSKPSKCGMSQIVNAITDE